MELLFDVLIVIGIVLFSIAKGKKKGEGTGARRAAAPNRSRQTAVPNRPRTEEAPGKNLTERARHAAREWQKSVYEADRDSHYDRDSLDYCDSDVPSSGGITFRQLPPGTDELAYLARFNRNREKLLEQSLESRDS